jgi:hypothetical protein
VDAAYSFPGRTPPNPKEETMSKIQLVLFRLVGLFLVLISLFFVFYTARLLYVTHGLTQVRPDGKGAYIGAVVFPLLALLSGIGAWRIAKKTLKRQS